MWVKQMQVKQIETSFFKCKKLIQFYRVLIVVYRI
jgi:hypothetical protein